MQSDGDLHIAIIPDGNRRWARKKKRPVWYGHSKGAKKLEEVLLEWCSEYSEIKIVSVYALSTENLNRSKKELETLWDIYKKHLDNVLKSKKIKKQKIRINVLGNSAVWRSDVREAARAVMRATQNYTRGIINILLAYGGQFEITEAVKKFVKKGMKTIPLAENTFNKFLMVTKPVDLVIRTGGEHRLSNFLLYQSAYAEIYFTETLWPAFSKREFKKIMNWYKKRNKRFGH